MSKLVDMLKYVSEHNDFYKKRIKEYGISNPLDITQWPILTRKELQENRYNMFSDGYKSKYFNQQLIRQSSSGSSGMPVNVYWDYKDWYVSNMSLWRKRWQWYGIKSNHKNVVFTLNSFGESIENKTLFCLISERTLSFNISLINSIEEYNKIVELIDNFEPGWLYIQPFVLNKLILSYTYLEKTPPKSIKYIESVGEILSNDIRRRAINLFQCHIADMYGSEEMNGIAIESPEGIMEILHDNIWIEVSNIAGINSVGSGNAIITNLNNHAMPLIRYCQDDDLLLNFHNTEDNEKMYIQLEQIKGRSNDSIITQCGVEINSFLLSEIISEVNNILSDIIVEYKYIYKKTEDILYCALVLKKDFQSWSSTVKNNIIAILGKKTNGNINLKLNISTESLFKCNVIKGRLLEVVD